MLEQTSKSKSVSMKFFDAIDRAKESKTRGSILSYEIMSCPLQGRVIRVQNNNGLWSPYPLFVEHPKTIH